MQKAHILQHNQSYIFFFLFFLQSQRQCRLGRLIRHRNIWALSEFRCCVFLDFSFSWTLACSFLESATSFNELLAVIYFVVWLYVTNSVHYEKKGIFNKSAVNVRHNFIPHTYFISWVFSIEIIRKLKDTV